MCIHVTIKELLSQGIYIIERNFLLVRHDLDNNSHIKSVQVLVLMGRIEAKDSKKRMQKRIRRRVVQKWSRGCWAQNLLEMHTWVSAGEHSRGAVIPAHSGMSVPHPRPCRTRLCRKVGPGVTICVVKAFGKANLKGGDVWSVQLGELGLHSHSPLLIPGLLSLSEPCSLVCGMGSMFCPLPC